MNCAHCGDEYKTTGPKSKYCRSCRELQKRNKLPHLAEATKKWRAENREHLAESNKRSRLGRKDMIRKQNRDTYHTKLKHDPMHMFKLRIKSLIRSSLKRRRAIKTKMYREILGCDWETFSRHVERQFSKGMSWENRNLWHIDHIVPLATAKTREDIIRLNHYTNLRPLWAHENLMKSSKVEFLL